MSLALVVLAGACSSSSGGDDGRPIVLMGQTYADAPWPSDQFLDPATGHLRSVDLGLEGKPDAVAALAASLTDLDGAPMHSSIFFPTRGGTRAEGPVTDGHAWIVDLGAKKALSPEMPLFYRASTHELVAMTSSDLVLVPGSRYACVVKAPGFARSHELEDALAGRGPNAALGAAMGDATAAAGVAAGDVAAATVFTVGHPTTGLHTVRAQLDALPPPKARVVRVMATAEALDDFFGKPTTTRSGLGDPAGIVHDALAAVVLGEFDAPGFATGDAAHLGKFEIDPATGQAKVKGSLVVPFMLALPKRTSLAGTPVMIFQHGLNASRMQVGAVANDYAKAGYATIGIDAIYHGARTPGSRDQNHNYTGTPGPDGLADDDPVAASLTFFDFGGDSAAGIIPLEARVVRDNLRQAALDIASLVRLLKGGDMSAVAAADPSLAALTLDADPLVYSGESFGSVTGSIAAAIEPGIAAATLAVPGAGIFVPLFADSPTFGVGTSAFVRNAFDPDLDVSDPTVLPAEAQRSLAILEEAIEPGDPVAYAAEIGAAGKSLLMLQAFSDETIPNQSGELIAKAAGATAVSVPGRTKELRYVTLPSAPAPLKASAPAPVVAVLDVDPATHIMYTRFGDARNFVPGFPPAAKEPAPVPVDEPIEWLHQTATAFADSVRARAPEVAPPP